MLLESSARTDGTLAPVQDDPQAPEYRFSTLETDAQATGEIVASAFDKLLADEVLADRISPSALATMLSQHIWNKPVSMRSTLT